jgi:signal transduction histidine kinase
MLRRISTLVVYLIYVLAIAMTTALLVFWVLVVDRFNIEINQLISNLTVEWNHFHWFIQSTGAALIFLTLLALTFLLAVTLGERRYSGKRDELLSNITHELRTPVAAIKLHAQTLQQDDLTGDQRRQSVDHVLRESDRVSHLVDDLLETSRQLSRTTELRPIRLAEFFRAYQDQVKQRFDLSKVDIHFEIHSRSVVMATTASLERIMDNLIANALRFTDAGGEILCRVIDSRQSAEIIVTDNGVGIPRGELGRIFDRFYQLRRQLGGRPVHGTAGLGLAIVRALVEDMRGKIRAVSGEAAGARFEIRLPRTRRREIADRR